MALSEERLAEIGLRATDDIATCAAEEDCCPRGSCFMPEVRQNAEDLLLLVCALAASEQAREELQTALDNGDRLLSQAGRALEAAEQAREELAAQLSHEMVLCNRERRAREEAENALREIADYPSVGNSYGAVRALARKALASPGDETA